MGWTGSRCWAPLSVTLSEAKGLEEAGLAPLDPRFFVRLQRTQNDSEY